MEYKEDRMKLNYLTATELIKKLRQKKIKAEEVCRDCLEMIALKDKEVKAWEYINEELVLRYAREIDRKKDLKTLHGVPVAVKDIFNTKDMPTTMGSPIWKGFMPGNDARVVHNIRMNDGIILGKTVTAEFAVHFLPEHKTRNPHSLKHSPGTSSSGSAAAVASHMVPLALGTQTAGSIIRPASYCGIFGFKPTFGTVPRTAMLKTTDTLDTVGCFARSIDDIRILFDSIRVSGSNYPFVNNCLKEYDVSKRSNIRIGVISDTIDVFRGFEQYVFDRFDAYINKLGKKNNVRLTKIKPSSDFNKIHRIHSLIYDKTLSYYFKEEFKQKTFISDIMYEIIARGNKIPVADYIKALTDQARIRQAIGGELKSYDAILTPSTAGEPPLAGEIENPDTCLIWTFLGWPSLNIPMFRGPHNMPMGLQAVAKRYDDYKLLYIAKNFLI